jgi:hypothetical protein
VRYESGYISLKYFTTLSIEGTLSKGQVPIKNGYKVKSQHLRIATPVCTFRWIQRIDGLYLLQSYFW